MTVLLCQNTKLFRNGKCKRVIPELSLCECKVELVLVTLIWVEIGVLGFDIVLCPPATDWVHVSIGA